MWPSDLGAEKKIRDRHLLVYILSEHDITSCLPRIVHVKVEVDVMSGADGVNP